MQDDEIVSLDEHENARGVLRVQFDRGWVSAVSGDGEQILEVRALAMRTRARMPIVYTRRSRAHTR